MPVPTPTDDDISSCISALKHEDPSMSNEQAAAICYSKRRGEMMHSDFQRILVTFMDYFKDGTGLNRFNAFITNNSLDIARKYHPFNQFNESFQWIEPLIQHYKSDTEAKYYKVRALTANISMNDNDYRDYQKLIRASSSMMMKPVNYNHDPGRWLPFPRTRVDMVGMEDLAMELILRVDNRDRYLQMQLDHDPQVPRREWINHPSVQGFGVYNGEIEWAGLACLESGVQLPGDPLSEIVPLILNESIRNKFCKIVDGLVVCEVGETKNENVKKYMSNINDLNVLSIADLEQKLLDVNAEIDSITIMPEADPELTARLDILYSLQSQIVDLIAQMKLIAVTAEQMTETPPESTEMSDEERAFMDECTASGKSRADCALEWQHKLGATQPPATDVPDFGSPTTPLSQDEPPAFDLTAAPLPETEPPIAAPDPSPIIPDISPIPAATLPAIPLIPGAAAEQVEPLDAKPPQDEHASFIQACSAQGKSEEECEAEWQLRQELPSEFQPPATESRLLACSERNVQLQAQLAAKATHEVTLLNENATLREQLSTASKVNIMYNAEKEHTRLLKNENTQLRSHITKNNALLTNTKDRNVIELKDQIDENRRLERKVDAKTAEVTELQEKVDTLMIHGTRLRRDVSQLTTKTTKSNDRARSAVKDRSDTQIENAHLRDEAARITRQLSTLTIQRAADAKKMYALEKRGLEMSESLSATSRTVIALRKDLKVAGDRVDKAWNKLNDLGEYVVKQDGTLVAGPPQ